jgi:UDP-N-acetylmuramate dehydrogenase
MTEESIIQQLPPIRGRYISKALLAEQTWFRVGGKADVLFRPVDEDDLIEFLIHCPNHIPRTILGAGSNVLVRDQGLRGVVIRLGRGFSTIIIEGEELTVGAGALDRTVALTCADHGLGGFEFLVGIPGTMGGAVKMNAGAYGREIKDCLLWAEAVDFYGVKHRLNAEDLKFKYRHSELSDQMIVTKVRLKGYAADPTTLHQTLARLLREREDSQPVRGRTGGSTFKNPPQLKAWELIDQAGCRGLTIGGAQMSPKHCNFMLNLGNATANDLENLGELVRQRVLASSGINLEWEIIRLG